MRKHSSFLLMCCALIFLFSSCQEENYSSTNQNLTEVKSAISGFDMSILLESDIEAVRELAKATEIVPASLPVGVSGITINPSGPTLPAGANNVTITATGTYTASIPVRAYNYLNSSDVIFSGSIPGNGTTGGSAAFVIPDYQDPGDGQSRYIMVEYQNSGWNYLVVYLQEPSQTTVKFQSNITGDIPAAGNTYTITQLGDYPSVIPEMASFRAIDDNGTTISNNVLIIPPSKTTNITIEANTATTNRNVYLQYSIDNGVTWVTFETHNQLGEQVQLVFSLSVNAVTIPADGGTYTVTLTGDFTTNATDVMFIRAISGSSEVSSAYTYFIGTVQKTTPITIVANPSTNIRPVEFQYSTDGYATWITFQVVVQEAKDDSGGDDDHVILKTGRIVAFNDALYHGNTGATKMYWSEAMGIGSNFNTSYFYTTYSGGNVDNSKYIPTVNTGCAAYSETRYPAGSWFAPTIDELQEINERKSEITYLAAGNERYWASSEYLRNSTPAVTDKEYAYYVIMHDMMVSFTYFGYKINQFHVRCVATRK